MKAKLGEAQLVNSINYTSLLGPSGIFEAKVDDLAATSMQLINPGLLEPWEQKKDFAYNWSTEKNWLEQEDPTKWPLASNSDFAAYGSKIVAIAEDLVDFEPDCCLGPLRGSSIPSSLIAVSANDYATFDFFTFRDHSNNLQRIERELISIIMKRNLRPLDFHVAVVDTAVGGHGVNNLTDILKSIWSANSSYREQRWQLRFHLLHDRRKGTNLGKILSSQKKAEPDGFEITVVPHQVPRLIAEDYGAAINFQFDTKSRLYTPATEPGEILLLENNEVWRIRSNNAFKLFMAFYVEGVLQALTSDPKYQLKSIVWR